jgi:hypothetical protein
MKNSAAATPVSPAASTPHIVADKLAASQAKASAALVLFVALVAAGLWGWDVTGEPVTTPRGPWQSKAKPEVAAMVRGLEACLARKAGPVPGVEVT